MDKQHTYSKRLPLTKVLPPLIVAISIISLVVPLGSYPVTVITDEPIRALVTWEMIISGDWLTPTLNGELYFNKPPLYNWLIILSWKVFGVDSLFGFRFPMIFSFYLLAGLVWYFTYLFTNDKRLAWLSSLTAVTHGRLMYYDTLLGLIDLSYACVTYTTFMVIYGLGSKGRWTLLFIVSWLLTAVGTLMKGYTSPVFQILTLVAYFFFFQKDKWKIFFSWRNLVGILVFMAILSCYYIPYFLRNPIAPAEYFGGLFENSSKGTPLQHNLSAVILHLITYPFKMLYDFAPWMWLIMMFFQKNIHSRLKANPFIYFNMMVFAVNFTVYWLSPETFARYLFMLLPLLFTSAAYLYLEQDIKTSWQRKTLDVIFLTLMVAVTLCFAILPFIPIARETPLYIAKSLLLFGVMALLSILSFQQRKEVIFFFTLALFVVRIGFNWFVLEHRGSSDRRSVQDGEMIHAKAAGKPVFIYGKNYHEQKSVIGSKNGISYNYSKASGQILRFSEDKTKDAVYLAATSQLDSVPHIRLYTFANFHIEDSIVLFRFTNPYESR